MPTIDLNTDGSGLYTFGHTDRDADSIEITVNAQDFPHASLALEIEGANGIYVTLDDLDALINFLTAARRQIVEGAPASPLPAELLPLIEPKYPEGTPEWDDQRSRAAEALDHWLHTQP